MSDDVVSQYLVEFERALVQALQITAIDHENQRIRSVVVVVPQASDFILASDIPHRHVELLVLNVLDIESHRWNASDAFGKFQRIQQRSLTSGIESEEEYAAFLQAAELVQE